MQILPTTRLPVLIAGLLTGTIWLDGAGVEIEKQSQGHLEQRLSEIDSKLNKVAHLSLRSGSGSIGYRSNGYSDPDNQEWVKIQLTEARTIEEVILVPTLSRSSQSGFHADAFPKEIRIWAGTDEDPKGQLVGTFYGESGTLPRIAPLPLKINSTTASWIRIEATQMSRRDFDGKFCLQLSEVMVFSSQENIALHQTVFTSSDSRENSGAWSKEYLTDGHTPFLMDAANGEHSSAYLGTHMAPPALTIDLERAYPLSQVYFHAMETSDTIPTALAGVYGMPNHLKIEGANRSDFSDAVLLLEVVRENLNESGPIMMWPLPDISCRFVRISGIITFADVPSLNNQSSDNEQARRRKVSVSSVPVYLSWIGFSEIELMSQGENIALNKPFTALNITTKPGRDIKALSDGRNFYGSIFTIHEWMSQLAERHDLELERGVVIAELALRYAKQKQTLSRLIWLAATLTVVIFIIIYVERKLHRHRLANVKQRFAADLHDEIGANLHTIKLTSQLISKRSDQLPKEINQLTERIQVIAERTNRAIRHVTNIQTSTTPFTCLADELKRIAERILIGVESQFKVVGEQNIGQLNPRRHNDLLLLYQECLINICRHSSASEVGTFLTASQNHIELIVNDNGTGMAQDRHNQIPPSLSRRAKLLGAKIRIESSQGNGTKVVVNLRRRSRLRRAFS